MTTAVLAPPQTPARTARHIDALDGVRGIAILLVLFTHAVWFFRVYPDRWYYFPAHLGWSGVDLFFVLSGFLITGILIRTKNSPNRAKAFYMRRVLRIFPLYYGVLLALFIGLYFSGWLRGEFPVRTWSGWAMYLLYLQNWAFLHNSIYWTHNIVGHFWSLAIEEQFYLIWPWLVWALSTRAVVRLCIAGMLASLALRIVLMGHFGPDNWAYDFALTPTRGEGLLMGAALAAYSAEVASIPKRTLEIMTAIGAAILLAMLAADSQAFFTPRANAYRFTIGVTAFNLIYGALVGSTQYTIPYLTRALNWNWLRSFGKYSYGIYVYHEPIFALTRHAAAVVGYSTSYRSRYAIPFFVMNVAITYCVAWLSYRYFESFFLQLKDRFRPAGAPARPQPSA